MGSFLPSPALGLQGPGAWDPSLPPLPPSPRGFSSVSPSISYKESVSWTEGHPHPRCPDLEILTPSAKTLFPDTALFPCSGGAHLWGPPFTPLSVYKITFILGDHHRPIWTVTDSGHTRGVWRMRILESPGTDQAWLHQVRGITGRSRTWSKRPCCVGCETHCEGGELCQGLMEGVGLGQG